MGRRQRETQFIGLSDEDVVAIAHDPRETTQRRRKARRELKFRGVRNAQKRQR